MRRRVFSVDKMLLKGVEGTMDPGVCSPALSSDTNHDFDWWCFGKTLSEADM